MSALFSPDSLLGRYEGLLGERSSLENKIKNLEAELRQVRAAATMSRSSRDGQDELDVLLHSFDGSEVFVGRTGSGSPSKQRGIKRGVNNAPKTRSSSTGLTCGTPLDSSQSGWTSVDTFMSTETTLCDSEGFGSKDSFEGFQEKKGHAPSHVKDGSELQSGTFFSALDKRAGVSRQGSNNGRPTSGPSENISSGSDGPDRTGLSGGLNSSPHENWTLMESRPGSSIGGGGGGGFISTGGGNGGTMEQNTTDGRVFEGDDAPSRLSVMSDGQISKLIGDREVARLSVLSESQMSKLLPSNSVRTPARFLGSSGGRFGKSTKDVAGSGSRGGSGESNSMGRCFSLDSKGGSVGGAAKISSMGSKPGSMTSSGGGPASFSSVSSLQDSGSLMSDGRMDSKASLDLLCKEMMKGIDEMKSMSQAITRRTNILAATHSTGDLERASTMPLSSSSSALLLLSNSDEVAVNQDVPLPSKNDSRMVKTDPEIPAFLTREMQPFTKDSAREKRVISPATQSPEPDKSAVVSPAMQECSSRERQSFTGDLSGSFGRGSAGGAPAGTIAGDVPASVFPACLTREMQSFDSRAGTINKHSLSLGNGAELLQRNVAQESLALPEEDDFSKELYTTESIKKRPRTDVGIGYEEGRTVNEDWNGLPSSLDREMEQFHSSADDLTAQEVDWAEGHVFNNEFGEDENVQKRPPRPRTPLPLQFLRSLGQEPKGEPAEFRTFRNLCEAVYSGGRTSPSDEEIVGAVQGEVNRVLMESPELGNEGGLMDMVDSVTKELGTRSLQRRLLSPVLEELSHRSNNIDSVEDPPGEDCARRAIVRREIRSPFADYLSDSVGDDDDDVDFWASTSGNPVNRQGCGNRELACRSTVKPPPKLIECCFSSSSRGDGVVLSRRATVAASQSETTLTDFVISQAVVSTGTVQFDICCEKLEGWAFVGILAASAMDPVRPRSLAESPTAYGWTSDSEFFEGGVYHYEAHEAQNEMLAPGVSFQVVVDCTRGMVSLRAPQVSRLGAKHQCHKRYLVCEMEDLPAGEWRLAIEWLGTAKFELLDVKRWA